MLFTNTQHSGWHRERNKELASFKEQKWPLVKLEEVCAIVKDKPEEFIGTKKYYSTGSIGTNQDNGNYEMVDYKNRPSRADLLPKLGDVGFAKMKNTNKTILIDEQYSGSIFSTGFTFLRPDERILSRFLLQIVSCANFQNIKDKYAVDGIMGGIRQSDILKLEIPLPPLDAQEQIIAELSTHERIIGGAKLVVSSYKPTIKIDPRWEIVELGSIIDVITDYHANGSYEILKDHVVLKDKEDFALMIRSTDFENDFKDDLKYIDQRAYEFLSKSKLFGGELITQGSVK